MGTPEAGAQRVKYSRTFATQAVLSDTFFPDTRIEELAIPQPGDDARVFLERPHSLFRYTEVTSEVAVQEPWTPVTLLRAYADEQDQHRLASIQIYQ